MRRATFLPALLILVGLVAFGATLGLSQEEEGDVCAVVFEPEEEWSAQAYAYCDVYCVQLDCDGTPAEDDAETCLALLDQYAEATDGQVPPCEMSQ